MRDDEPPGSTSAMFGGTSSMPSKVGNMLHSDPNMSSTSSIDDGDDSDYNKRNSSFSAYDPSRLSCEGSPMMMSPWNQTSPFAKSPWSNFDETDVKSGAAAPSGLIGSLVREEGHIYSLAAINGLLYTGSDSKNIRVWKDLKEFSAFKSNSGLVKAIIICGGKIFTGHQDGKVRVWKVPSKDPSLHKRCGTLPTMMDIFKCSIKPKNYIEVKRNKTTLWIKHCDAISSLSMSQEHGLLYSASWDRTFKVWRVENSKCLESVKAHDDAVNSIVAGPDNLVFTGSADGSVKVWKREPHGKVTKHVLIHTLLDQESAITSLAVNASSTVLYCGSSDGNVNFWECDKQLAHGGILKGHKLAVLCLEAAGPLLFSGSADKNICVWRREGSSAHNCLSVLTGHTGPVKCLTVEKDQESTDSDPKWVVYSGSLDKSVKVWSVAEQAPDMGQISSGWDSIPSAKY